MNKKTIFIVIAFGGLCVLLLILSIALGGKNSKNNAVLPTPTPFIKRGVNNTSPIPTVGFRSDGYCQDCYPKNTSNITQKLKWALSLPLKSSGYYIFYNPESDQIIVDLYSSSSLEPEQSADFKNASDSAKEALINIGVNLQQQKVIYRENLVTPTPAP